MSAYKRMPWHSYLMPQPQHQATSIALEEGWALDCIEQRVMSSKRHIYLSLLRAGDRVLRVLPNGAMLVTYDGRAP